MSNLPNLRFRDYRDGWAVTPLKESLSFISYGFTNPMPEADSGPYMITAKEITNGKIRFEDARKTTPVAFEELLTDKSRPVYGDILLTKDGTLGRLAVVGDELFCINQSVAVLRPIPTVCSNFLYQLLSTPKYQRIMLRNAGGSTIKHIYITVVDKMKIGTPTLAEQRKIAEFLGSVDAKLNALGRKRDLLAEYKRGTMQKLFSQEIRFTQEDGRPFPDWETKKLGELFKFKVGGDVGKLNFSKTKTDTHQFPVYANGDGEGLHGYADDYQYDPPAVTVTGRGNLGNARFRQERFNAIVRLIVIKINEQFDGKFVEEAINNLNIFVESTGVPQLTAPQLSNYRVSFPCKKEQQKIAAFLTAIDNKITAVDQQITHIETFKKGLLQQMFV